MTTLRQLHANHITELPAEPPAFERSVHQWSQAEIDALIFAEASKRPLLVRGEPGVGKTQIARAVAVHCGWCLHAVTIHPRFDPQHLIARFDAVLRLADAQAQRLDPTEKSYWTPGPIWQAYDWQGAQAYSKDPEQTQPRGHVILIDEIDKADSDLPNSLLELLGQRSFAFAPLGLRLGGPNVPQPLVVITTNEERELPAAFLRRCIVLNLAAGGDYQAWLMARGRAHFAASRQLADDVLAHAARQLVDDRSAMQQAGLPPPGAAEYLDLLSAVHELAPGDTAAQLQWLDRLSAYSFVKHSEGAPLTQNRSPVGSAEPGSSSAEA
jgi:MoxR-like ATPase